MAASREDDFDAEDLDHECADHSADHVHGDKRKRIFSKERECAAPPATADETHDRMAVRCMMYGFGDDQNPYTESVDMLEDLVISYITEVICKAMDVGKSGRVQVEDVMYLVRADAKKCARVKDLLSMNEELKRARKAFDEVKYAAI